MELEGISEIEVEIKESGPQGPPGLSAYEVYLKNGGTLSETEWLESLKGETGGPGANGKDGYTPVKGIDYFTEEDIASLEIPTKTSDLENDSDFTTNTYVDDAIGTLSNSINEQLANIDLTELDPTVPEHVKAITEEQISAWNKAINSAGGAANNNEIYDIVTEKYLTGSATLTDTYDQFTAVLSKYISGEITLPTFRLKNNRYGSATPELLLRLSQISNNNYKYEAYKFMIFSSSGLHLYKYTLSLTVDTTTGVVSYAAINNVEYRMLADGISKSYTPTDDYHPATKKYVDDSIANIDIPEVDLTGYATTEYVDEAIANVEIGGESGSINLTNILTKDNTEEFTPDGDYEPATKKYVDDSILGLVILNNLQLGSSPGNGYGIVNETILNKILNGIVKGGNFPPAILANNGQKSILFTYVSNYTSNTYKEFRYYGFSPLAEKTNTFEVHYLKFRINGMGYMAKDEKTISDVSTSFYNINRSLNTDNTVAYTPTADYHPSTKKYVDDSIAAAITTVLEAEY